MSITSSTAMKDWPIPLRISAEAVTLAEQIYRSRCAVYGPQLCAPFSGIEPSLRQDFIALASEILACLKPEQGKPPQKPSLILVKS